MKRQPRPFSIEIKRSRRSLASAPSQPTATELTSDAPQGLIKPEPLPNTLSDTELVIPAFLQSGRTPQKLSAQENAAAVALDRDKVFAPPASTPNSDQTQRRILPSLIGDEVAEPATAAPSELRRGRKTKSDAAPKIRAAVAPRRERPDKNFAKRYEFAQAEPAAPTKASPAEKSEIPAPIPPAPKLRAGRVRLFLNPNRDNVAALPPGQRWKRRLHPRAW